MYKCMRTSETEQRILREREATEYCGMGRTSFRQWAAKIGAVRKFGRSVRYDRKVIDEALDGMNQNEG